MKFGKNDFIVFLCYLSFCLVVLSGGFQHSVFVGFVTFILLTFIFELLFVLYLFIRKIVLLIYNDVVQPLQSTLQEYREELDEIKKD